MCTCVYVCCCCSIVSPAIACCHGSLGANRDRVLNVLVVSVTAPEVVGLQAAFAAAQTNGLLSEAVFWDVVGRASPVLRASVGSLLNQRMFRIFAVTNPGGVTCLEFMLAVAVLAGKAPFLDRPGFAFDIFNLHQTGSMSLALIAQVLSSLAPLPTAVGAGDASSPVVFFAHHPSGAIHVSVRMLVQAYGSLFKEADTDNDGLLTRSEYASCVCVSVCVCVCVCVYVCVCNLSIIAPLDIVLFHSTFLRSSLCLLFYSRFLSMMSRTQAAPVLLYAFGLQLDVATLWAALDGPQWSPQ